MFEISFALPLTETGYPRRKARSRRSAFARFTRYSASDIAPAIATAVAPSREKIFWTTFDPTKNPFEARLSAARTTPSLLRMPTVVVMLNLGPLCGRSGKLTRMDQGWSPRGRRGSVPVERLSWPPSEGGVTAVHGHRRARHERDLVARQKQNGLRDLLRCAGSALRDRRDETPIVFAEPEPGGPRVSVEHGRAHLAWADCIHADSVFRVFDGERAREENHPALRRAVRGRERRRDKARVRSHVDDVPAPPTNHRRQGVLRAQERPFEVDIKDRIPISFRHLLRRFLKVDPGVVHEHVDRSERPRRSINEPLRVSRLRHVTLDSQDLAVSTQRLDSPVESSGASARDRDRRTFVEECIRSREADSRRTARNEDDPSFETRHRPDIGPTDLSFVRCEGSRQRFAATRTDSHADL